MPGSLTGLTYQDSAEIVAKKFLDGGLGILPVPRCYQKNIVDGSVTTLFDYDVQAGAGSAGFCIYHVFASDDTNHQAMSGIFTYSAVNKAGTVTASAIGYATANDCKSVSSGTLTLAWSNTAGTLKATVGLQPTGSLTETKYCVCLMIFPAAGAITLV